MTLAIAHLDPSSGRTHLLEDHLRRTAKLAEGSGAKFDSAEWARLAAIWHDLGKYRPAFQKMIRDAGGENAHLEKENNPARVDHSSVGAAYAQRHLGARGLPIALAISGHHCGLQNFFYWRDDRHPRTFGLLDEIPINNLPHDIRDIPSLELPPMLSTSVATPDLEAPRRRAEFWTRMLFSALVDADFLDTEAFFDQKKSDLRGNFLPLDGLTGRLRRYLEQLTAKVERNVVNDERARVLAHCREMASHPRGVFSLTVPTGGGKTYASLAFALEHALANKMDRVIVVAPYLTIIDQTVGAYRKALASEGAGADDLILIEHHSGIEPEEKNENPRNRLATENWDAALIVTTAVQFIESLFSRRPSQCRKLHNLARSVIVIDEAQTLPGDFLVPILEVMQELVDFYGASILLSTATQPELKERVAPDGRHVTGFREVVEIAGTPDEIADSFKRLRRVRPERTSAKGWDEIAALVAQEPKALAITHRRDDARELAERVRKLRPDEPLFHLSALMCARHRQERIETIKLALNSCDEPTRVISTQLVESGVDFDFPVVFRAMAGLDALIQSAGRCNREGHLEMGRLVIFEAPTLPPIGQLRTAADETRTLFVADPKMDIFDPEIYRRFDKRLDRVQDRKGIQNLRAELAFQNVDREFEIINDAWQTTLIVPWGPIDNRKESLDILADAEHSDDPKYLRWIARRLQRYSVSIPRHLANSWLEKGVLYSVQGLFLALRPEYCHLYTEDYGLTVSKEAPVADPSALIG